MWEMVTWAFTEVPWYYTYPIWAVVGAVIGINIRFWVSRHLWVQHQFDRRKGFPDGTSCWCEKGQVAGDIVVALIYVSLILWPLFVPALIIMMLFKGYNRTLYLIHAWATKGAVKWKEEIKDFAAAKEQIGVLEKEYKALREDNERLTKQVVERDEKLEFYRNEIRGIVRERPKTQHGFTHGG